MFRKSNLYIAGESYSGVYAPMVVDRIIKGQKVFPINLKVIKIQMKHFNFKK